MTKKILGTRGAPVASLDPKMALGVQLGDRLWALISIPADCSCLALHTHGYTASHGLGVLVLQPGIKPRPLAVGLAGSSDGKESACNAGDSGSIPGPGRSPREGNGNPFTCSCLENLMDGGAWWATAHGVKKRQT